VRDLDVGQVLALGQQRRASLGFVAGQPGRDEVEPCVGDADATACGDVQHDTRGFCAVASDDDAGGGAAQVLADEAQQLGHRGGLRAGGVDQQEPAGPRVVAELGGTCCGHVAGHCGDAVDRGDGVGEHLGGEVWAGVVVADALGVHRRDLRCDADAVHGHLA
jgi:hypothetical protein